MQAMEEWTAIYTELLFRNIKIQCNSGVFFGQSLVTAIKGLFTCYCCILHITSTQLLGKPHEFSYHAYKDLKFYQFINIVKYDFSWKEIFILASISSNKCIILL